MYSENKRKPLNLLGVPFFWGGRNGKESISGFGLGHDGETGCWDEMNRRFVIQSALEGNAGGLVTE